MPVAKRVSPDVVSIVFHSTVSLTAIGVLLLIPVRARAADLSPSQGDVVGTPSSPSAAKKIVDQTAFLTKQLAEWKVVLGGGAMIVPKFEGSDEFKVVPVPFVSASFGDTMRIDPRGLSFNVYKQSGLSFGVRVGYERGRREGDSDHLRGLGDIDAGAAVGGRLAYELGPLEFYTTLNQIIGGSKGLEGKFGADASFRYDRFLFMAGVSGTWANAKYMETYFGVTPSQSALSGLPVYDAGAGIKRVDVQASVTYQVADHWLVRGQVGLGYLVGEAADSPIVQSKSQPFGMLSIGYKF